VKNNWEHIKIVNKIISNLIKTIQILIPGVLGLSFFLVQFLGSVLCFLFIHLLRLVDIKNCLSRTSFPNVYYSRVKNYLSFE
jgi:uncharacterized membrane protein